MIRTPLLLCCAALTAPPASSVFAEDSPPSYAEIVARVVEARGRLVSGIIVYETRHEWLVPAAAPPAPTRLTRIAFENGKRHVDRGGQLIDGRLTGVREQRILNLDEGYEIAYGGPVVGQRSPAGIPLWASATVTEIVPGSTEHRHTLDARSMGLILGPFIGNMDVRPGECVDHLPRDRERVEVVEGANGESLLRLSARWVGRDATAVYDVDPARDWSVVRFRLDAKYRGEPRTFELQNELAQFGGVWYPRTSTYSETDADGRRTGQETTTLLEAALNVPVAAAEFSPEAIEAAPGTELVVFGRPPVPDGAWTAIGFVPDAPPAPVVPPAPANAVPVAAPEGDRVGWLSSAGAVACCGLFWVRRARRRAGETGSAA